MNFSKTSDKDLIRSLVNVQVEIKLIRKRIHNMESVIKGLSNNLQRAKSLQKIKNLSGDILGKGRSIKKSEIKISLLKKKGKPYLDELEKRLQGNHFSHQKRISLLKSLNKELRQTDLILRGYQNLEISFSEVEEYKDENLRKEIDLFICHATEDKDDFVRPLASTLIGLGINVWYDEYSLKVGDSLRSSIDEGLSQSRYGLVIFSSFFFSKNWPQYELNGLITKEMSGQNKVILPIWHKITMNDVKKNSPSLADKVALNTALMTIEEIAARIAIAVK